MKTPADVRERARRSFQRNQANWLGGHFTPLPIALNPPTATAVAADNGEALAAWLREWAAWDAGTGAGPGVTVEYTPKRLGYLGHYELPTRVVLTTPEAVARAAGSLPQWRRTTALLERLTGELGEPTRAALIGQLGRWRDWDEATAGRFIAVVRWLRGHDAAEHYIREIPVIGVDSKWIERHTAVLRAVVGELRFRAIPKMVQLRSLDPGLRIHGLTHLALRVSDAAGDTTSDAPGTEATAQFERVLIVENQVTFLALPPLSSTLAIFGGGYRADDLVAALPWLAHREVRYWGDLDSHGFRILDHVRARLPQVTSVLMDPDTVRRHLDLAVEEPTATAFEPRTLTASERAALALLRERSAAGCLRIEQERIVFDYAVGRLRGGVD